MHGGNDDAVIRDYKAARNLAVQAIYFLSYLLTIFPCSLSFLNIWNKINHLT